MEFIDESKYFPGIQIKNRTLHNIHKLITKNLDSPTTSMTVLDSTEEKTYQFEGFQEAYKLCKNQPRKVTLSISEEKTRSDLNIIIRENGEVHIFGYFPEKELNLTISKIWEEIYLCDEDYPSYVKGILNSRKVKRILTILILGSSFALIGSIFILFYAQNVGVDLVDKSIIPKGNEHLKIIEHAIKSDSIEVKLDALLIKELKGFTNVSEVITRLNTIILIISVILPILLLIQLIIVQLRKRFPLTYFNLNTIQESRLTKMQKQRDIILISVLVAFIINLVSGIIITLTS